MKVLGTSKLTRKFQVTVPKSAREILVLETGDLLVFVKDDGKVIVKRGRIEI